MNTDKWVLVHADCVLEESSSGDFCEGEKINAGEASEEVVESWLAITWRRFYRNKVAVGSLILFLGTRRLWGNICKIPNKKPI